EKLKDWIEIYNNNNLKIEVKSIQSIIFKGKIKDFKGYEIFKDCKIIHKSVNANFNYYYINTSTLTKQQLEQLTCYWGKKIMNITESIKFNKIKEENEKIKKELAKLKQFQLKKSDFWVQFYCINCEKVDRCILSSCSENTLRKNYVLKDNSKSKYANYPIRRINNESIYCHW
ncbi:hypothetical protein C6B38_01520, partial [Spiroplasma sp. ChiS]